MGRLTLPPRARIYLDANILIHIVEDRQGSSTGIECVIGLIEASEVTAFTSELSLAEVLAKPMETGNVQVQRNYEALLEQQPQLSVLPISRSILLNAAQLRVDLRIKLPDAIHVATALAIDAKFLVSEDQRLRVPSSIQLVRLAEFRDEKDGSDAPHDH